MKENPDEQARLEQLTQAWVKNYVIEFNLCPFARKAMDQKSIRFKACSELTFDVLLEFIAAEFRFLELNPDTETTILIIAEGAAEFEEYLELLQLANELLIALNYEGVFQLASFHPNYQFANTAYNAAENFTNRSPLPLIHILRESSVEYAVRQHVNVANIPEKNIELMNTTGSIKLQTILEKFRAR